jgi:hypothetical protein
MNLSTIMVVTGGILMSGWGVAHLTATRSIVREFSTLPLQTRLIVLKEWIAEGFTLCSLGLLVLMMAVLGGKANPFAVLVCRLLSLLLLSLAGLGLVTGARSPVILLKISPWTTTAAALLILLGTI